MEILRMQRTINGFEIRKAYDHYSIMSIKREEQLNKISRERNSIEKNTLCRTMQLFQSAHMVHE